MNKKLFKFLFLVCSVAAVFTACSKDDEVDAPDSLVGTSWLFETEEDGVAVGIELDFTSATTGDVNIIYGGEKNGILTLGGFSAGEFTYTYSKPKVTLTIDGEKSTGKINGNKLTIDGEVFVKED